MIKEASRTGIWGGTGSGKSTRIKELVQNQNRVIVLDPTGDWGRERGYRIYKTLNGIYKAMKAGWNTGFKLVLYVDEMAAFPPDVLQQLSKGLMAVQTPYFNNKDRREITVVIDEMADFYPNMTLKADQMAFKSLVNKGRHYGINIIGASQRLAEVHTNFRGNCKEHYFFRMGSAVDYNTAAQTMGREYLAKHRALKTHQYLHFKSGTVSEGKNQANFR